MSLDGKVAAFMEKVVAKNPGEAEFHQAVHEVIESVMPIVEANPVYQKEKILERMVEPERIIMFRVPWLDDKGEIQVNRGFRVEFNNAIGPYKGGLRFHPTVNLGILKFLGFEQIFKNSLTTLPMGGGKGGVGLRSEGQERQRSDALLPELHERAVPAHRRGHRRAGRRHRRGRPRDRLSCSASTRSSRNSFEGVLTGKGLNWGGSLIRPEATGYGCVYFADEMLGTRGQRSRARPCHGLRARATWPSTRSRR